MSKNPYESPETPGKVPPQKKPKKGNRILGVFAVVAVLGILVALLLPATRFSREAPRRMQCQNHIKQIGLALQNYHDAYGALPPAYTVDADGKPLHSWRTLILPFMERQPLYEKIDLSKPWDDPANKEAYETFVETYSCPSASYPAAYTTYLAIVGPDCCFGETESRTLSEITDDKNRTLMVLEVDSERAVHWMSPTDIGEDEVVSWSAGGKHTHPGGTHAVTASGSVHFMSADTAEETWRAVMSVAGDDDDIAQEMD